MTSSSLSPARAARIFQPTWCRVLSSGLRGLTLAREAGMLLVWDDRGGLYLVNRRGERQAHRPLPGALTTACSADDGSAYAVIGAGKDISWLAPDLTQRWQNPASHPIVAAALDPFGQYLALADSRCKVSVLDRHGRHIMSADSPRPLHHLAFVPAAPYLVGTADFGLTMCFDFSGKCLWRAGLVAHTGSLAVSGTGGVISVACFTEGLQQYTLTGQSLGRWNMGEACRLAAMSFDGKWTLVAGLGNRLLLLDRTGRTTTHHDLDQPCIGLALAALGEAAYVALPDGRVLGLDVCAPPVPG